MKVTEENVHFLKKVSELTDEVIVKKIVTKDKKIEKNSATAVDTISKSMMIYSSQEKVFNDTFGIRKIKDFLKNVKEYGSFEEKPNSIIFRDAIRKVTFRKHDQNKMVDIQKKIPEISHKDYIKIQLSRSEVTSIINGLKDNKDLSDYITFNLGTDNIFKMIIGEGDQENIFELKVTNVERKDNVEMTFNSKLKNFIKIFNSLDNDREENEVFMFINHNETMIIAETNNLTLTKYYITAFVEDTTLDEME